MWRRDSGVLLLLLRRDKLFWPRLLQTLGHLR
jgi:hypothetical protein